MTDEKWERLDVLAAAHHPDPHFQTVCEECKGIWPCDVSRLVGALRDPQDHWRL